jgi:ABC-type spermidine/putrescine transport system permease subunit II
MNIKEAILKLYLIFISISLWMIFLIIFIHSFFPTLAFPPKYLTIEYWIGKFIPEFWPSLLLSILLSITVVLINLSLSLPAVYAIMRYDYPGKDFLNTLLLAPIFVPGMTLALGLLALYVFFLPLTNSFFGLAFALSLVTLPYMIRPIMSALSSVDICFEEAAKCLGANPLRTFLYIVLPLIGPGVLAGSMLSFVIALNEFTTIIFIIGPDFIPASIWLYQYIHMFGVSGSLAAQISIIQIISLTIVGIQLKILGMKYLKGIVF